MNRTFLLALVLTSSTQAFAQEPGERPSPTAAATEEVRQEAKRLFDRGVKLLEANKFDDALIDFRRSREVFPTRSATENAAICLRELGKTAEAFEMFRAVLREFPDLPPEVRARVETQVDRLDTQLGRLVFVSEPGTAVTVDGRPVGKLPFTEPLRVVAGRNVVRMFLDGYSVFETQVVSTRGKETAVEPKFQLLGSVGRVRIKERSDAAADVVIDGVVVGKAPWEGSLSPGDHAVWLSTEGSLGTAPTRARILLGQKTEAVLELTPLVASLRLSVSPPNAAVALDGVPLGTGGVDVALPAGVYKVDVSLEGFVSHAETIDIAVGKSPKLNVSLKPAVGGSADPFELGVSGAASLSPSLDGVDCDVCDRSIGAGGYVAISGGYRLPFGLGFELEFGYHRASGSLERNVSLQPIGLSRATPTTFAETYLMAGATILGGASYRPPLGDLVLLVVGSRFGGYVGGASVSRGVTGSDEIGDSIDVGPYKSGSELLGVVVKPEVHAGLAVTPWLDVWVSGAAMVVFPLTVEPWNYTELVPLRGDGAARFNREELWGTQLHLMPGLGVGLSL